MSFCSWLLLALQVSCSSEQMWVKSALLGSAQHAASKYLYSSHFSSQLLFVFLVVLSSIIRYAWLLMINSETFIQHLRQKRMKSHVTLKRSVCDTFGFIYLFFLCILLDVSSSLNSHLSCLYYTILYYTSSSFCSAHPLPLRNACYATSCCYICIPTYFHTGNADMLSS